MINKLKLKDIRDMLKFFMVAVSMITAIIVGVYAIVYSLINAFIFIATFIVGVIGLGFGLVTLKIIANKLT
tara:strand:+ start:1605 stop:1817 length:213 start_codon:yes stop_codon:yes gene_type:complete